LSVLSIVPRSFIPVRSVLPGFIELWNPFMPGIIMVGHNPIGPSYLITY